MALKPALRKQNDLPLQSSTDITNMVGTAIDHLMDLVKRLKELESSEVCVPESSIQAITSSIKELDNERLKCHDDLEVETIEASKLRHKLSTFPREIELEIREAIASARASNEAEIQRLEKKIEDIDVAIVHSDHKCQLRLVENLSLQPKSEKMELEYDETIALLNQSLADKASLQIQLNETRKRLKETSDERADLEKAIEEVKESMVDERQEAEAETSRIKEAILESSKKAGEMTELNEIKKVELAKLKQELEGYETKLQRVRGKISQYERSIANLASQGENLKVVFQGNMEENTALTTAGMVIVKETNEETEKLTAVIQELKEKLSEIKDEASKAAMEFQGLHEEKMKLLNTLELSRDASSEETDELAAAEEKLSRIKEDLMHNTRECARLQKENEEVESVIELLKQKHTTAMEILKNQLTEIGNSLSIEKKGRLELQNNRDSLSKLISDFQNEYTQQMTEMATKISEGKDKHQTLGEAGLLLHRDLKSDEVEIKTTQSILQQTKADFLAMQKDLEEKRDLYQKDIASIEEQIKIFKDKSESEKPSFEALEMRFSNQTEEFERKKKVVVELKNKKSSLEVSVDRLQAEIEKIEHVMPELRQSLQSIKAIYLKELSTQTEELKERESTIWVAEEKLKRLFDENARFTEAITNLELDYQHLAHQMEDIIDSRGKKEASISYFKGLIENTWKEDMELNRTYGEKDAILLDDISKLQEFTQNRERMINSINERLSRELDELVDFIDHVAGTRPTEMESEWSYTGERS